ncbi:Protein of unknown function DUF679 [Macleaya cordata]|uniref:Uncharacterized protein n=1 Tax=Macleaya cordata TaxID=56857 RepID=A0A200QX11_MACCD|nr:Protein of unknown function DUF679 [Macleaya cordata]
MDDVRKVLIENHIDVVNVENCIDKNGKVSHFISALHTIINTSARLNVLLPTAIILAFSTLAPCLTNHGKCKTLNRCLMGVFFGISSASCVFLAFTDSFRTGSGSLYYGVATFRGIWTLCKERPNVPEDYKLRWSDLFHACLYLVVAP